MTDAVAAEGLVKRYRSLVPPRPPRAVVDGLDLHVPVGGVTGLLGPNGAGKTTAVRILLGLARATAGRATVLGRDAWRESRAIRSELAYVPAERTVFEWMRAGDFIAGVASLSAGWDGAYADRLARRWEIDARATMRELSTGARSRVLLLAALARRTPLLVLDEPTTGLDPAAVDDALSELVGAAADGATILLVTHHLEEVDRICDRVTIMDRGRAALAADLDGLRASWRTIDVAGHPRPELMARWQEVVSTTTFGERTRLLVRDEPEAVAERVRMLGAEVTGMRQLTLREIYLAITSATRATSATSATSTTSSTSTTDEHAAHDDLA